MLVNTCVTFNVCRYHPLLHPPLPPSLLPCVLSYLRFSQGLPNHNRHPTRPRRKHSPNLRQPDRRPPLPSLLPSLLPSSLSTSTTKTKGGIPEE